MSLKKLFFLLFGSALISLLILGGSALWLNLKLADNQKVIMSISSLESSRIIIGVTISNLLSKQQSILAANSLEEMAAIPHDKSAEQEFINQLQILYIMVDNHQLNSYLLDSIQKASKTFFLANKQLYATKKAMLTTQEELKQLTQLNALGKSDLLLPHALVNLTGEFNSFDKQLLHQPHNLFSMRESLNEQALSLHKTITNIQKSNKIITEQFNQLYIASTALKNSLIKQAETITFYGTVFISAITFIMLTALLLTGGFILRTIGHSLTSLVKIMREVAEGKGGLTLRLKETRYEDINQVSDAFNTMANKLQFVHEHLQELIDQKTDALQNANSNLYAAQQIAQLGYWSYNPFTNTVEITKECAEVLGIPETSSTITYQHIIDMVDKEDNQLLQTLITNAFKQKEKFTQEIRFHPPNQTLRWFYLIGQPDTTEPCEKITFVVMDITHRKHTEQEIEALNEKLLASARRAGMADVATSILHNIGNVLNSVKVTIGLLNENIHTSSVNKLHAIIGLLKNHAHDLNYYLCNDNKGRLLPEYLLVLIPQIHQEHEKFKQELLSLDVPIKHIEDIVSMQKSISGTYDLSEKIGLSNIIDVSIQMCGDIFEKNQITLYKPPISPVFLWTDKSKILQILVNLIQNAKDALIFAKHPIAHKTITLHLETNEAMNLIRLFVTDNGEGIAPNLIEKIFSMGFTTKETGHGFGLHSSALAAKELGGSLQATSKGLGFGATFILQLPISNDAKPRRVAHVIE